MKGQTFTIYVYEDTPAYCEKEREILGQHIPAIVSIIRGLFDPFRSS